MIYDNIYFELLQEIAAYYNTDTDNISYKSLKNSETFPGHEEQLNWIRIFLENRGDGY